MLETRWSISDKVLLFSQWTGMKRSSKSLRFPAWRPSGVTSSLEVSAAFSKGLFPWRCSVPAASNYRLGGDTWGQTPDCISDWRSWRNHLLFYWTNPKNVTTERDQKCCLITATTHRYNSLIFVKPIVKPLKERCGWGRGANIGHCSGQQLRLCTEIGKYATFSRLRTQTCAHTPHTLALYLHWPHYYWQ